MTAMVYDYQNGDAHDNTRPLTDLDDPQPERVVHVDIRRIISSEDTRLATT